MRIDRIRVAGFGGLRGFDTGAGGLPGLIVVTGPNEAGKSTLFTFLTTALYGFQPATRERNPHVPWDADEAAGCVSILLDGGGCADVERRLRSQPTGRLTVDGRSAELRNQPLPWVEHVPRTVFRQVFAVTLGDLAGLDSETWARIQDKMVGTMGATDLRSARAVAEELEREAGETWRPNRRGNQRLRDLAVEGRALRRRRQEALERDARLRALAEENETVRARLREARAQRQRDRLILERAQSLRPIRTQRDRIASLRRQGGDRTPLACLPPDPPARMSELDEERTREERRLASIAAERADHEADVATFDGAARRILESRDDILRLVARAGTAAAERLRTAELEAELLELERELGEVASSLLEGGWREAAADLEALPIERLRELVARARVTVPGQAEGHRARRTATAVVAAVAGVLLLAVGAMSGGLVVTAAGAALTAVGLTLGAARVHGRAGRSVDPTGRSDGHPGRAAGAAVRALLVGLPMREERLRRADEALVGDLGRLRRLARERARRGGALEATRRRLEEVDAEAVGLAHSLASDSAGRVELLRDDGPRTAEAVAHALDVELRRAERRQHAAEAAGRVITRLAGERDDVAARLAAIEPELDRLRASGEALAPDDYRAGLEIARERLEVHRRADELREELERGHPDLAEIEARIDASSGSESPWELDDDALAATRARLEEVEEEVERLVKGSEALARDAAHLRELETVDAVDGAIAGLAERQALLGRERDRKWILAKLLRQADRAFREEHQPDLLRRASSYLRHLTGGRYERLLLDQREDTDVFQVVGPGLPAPVALAPPVSTGTLEQAYLSLRLAIVDHLDRGGERLPLFVDEVFVNWDRARRARGLEVLAAVSDTRQVFVFTCLEGMAAELEARGARMLDLELR